MSDTAPRRHSHACRVGDVVIGGGAPVVVQSMTNTDTADAVATAAPGGRAGRRPARRSCASRSTTGPPRRRWRRSATACATTHGVDVPLVGDFHYNGHTLLREFPDCAEALAKYRINPGNVGRGARHDANFATMVQAAIDHAPAGADRRQRRLARPGAARRPDGRERPPRRAAARPTRCCARRWCRARSRRPRRPRRSACRPTASCSRARRAACRTWSPSTATWRPAAPTRCTSA